MSLPTEAIVETRTRRWRSPLESHGDSYARTGFAAAADIDAGMVLGCAHPMGPLHLVGLIRLDTIRAIVTPCAKSSKSPLYAPVPLLSRMVDAGLLGRKSGRASSRMPEVAVAGPTPCLANAADRPSVSPAPRGAPLGAAMAAVGPYRVL